MLYQSAWFGSAFNYDHLKLQDGQLRAQKNTDDQFWINRVEHSVKQFNGIAGSQWLYTHCFTWNNDSHALPFRTYIIGLAKSYRDLDWEMVITMPHGYRQVKRRSLEMVRRRNSVPHVSRGTEGGGKLAKKSPSHWLGQIESNNHWVLV